MQHVQVSPGIVIIPDGNIALGKLAQALMHGAKVFAVQGNFDDALRIVREVTTRFRITLVNSINPYRIEGQKTGSFEICDVLGDAPDFHFIPVGNAGNIIAYWKGYKEYRERGRSQRLPKMMGFQAEGAAAHRPRTCNRETRDFGHGDPHWKPCQLASGGGGTRRERRSDRHGE
ncbi:MAG: hypothetical protein KatS3mg130_2010 [Candidatus Sumerlaea sp.]|nr:MAG: hypothetical protein KatS3mg130_2010 [Candidatus Sumerlaea sp.]